MKTEFQCLCVSRVTMHLELGSVGVRRGLGGVTTGRAWRPCGRTRLTPPPVPCSLVFGSRLDIHSGGVDLAFPHHENEIAQCEAFHQCPQWGNYFLHSGECRLPSPAPLLSVGSARALRWAHLSQPGSPVCPERNSPELPGKD